MTQRRCGVLYSKGQTGFTGVFDRRLQELHGKEYAAVRKNKKMVALRMSPESKTPSPEIPEGDEQFRLLVVGHREPDEWKTGPQDAPVIRDATFRQMIGACTGGLDQKLQAAVADQKCKPANRMQRQLWKKALITEQEKFEAHQTEDRGSSSAGQGRETVTGQAGQDSPAVGGTHRDAPKT